MLSIIVAVANGGAIGRGGDLPFHLSPDLRHFKAVTMGKPIIMGRKTFESLPGGALPGRRNIVVTRNGDYCREGIETVGSLDEALDLVKDVEEAMIIGGGEIYRQALPMADRLYLTQVDTVVDDADTFFPDYSRWFEPVGPEPPYVTDERSGLRYRFVDLVRR